MESSCLIEAQAVVLLQHRFSRNLKPPTALLAAMKRNKEWSGHRKIWTDKEEESKTHQVGIWELLCQDSLFWCSLSMFVLQFHVVELGPHQPDDAVFQGSFLSAIQILQYKIYIQILYIARNLQHGFLKMLIAA